MGLRVEPLRSVRGFRLTGDLDFFGIEGLREMLRPELHGTLFLDLFNVGFMDDSGLGVLAWALHGLQKQRGTLVLWNPPRSIRRVFEMTGLDRVEGLRIDPP